MSEEYTQVESPWNCELYDFEEELKRLGIEFTSESIEDGYDSIRYSFNTESDKEIASNLLDGMFSLC